MELRRRLLSLMELRRSLVELNRGLNRRLGDRLRREAGNSSIWVHLLLNNEVLLHEFLRVYFSSSLHHDHHLEHLISHLLLPLSPHHLFL